MGRAPLTGCEPERASCGGPHGLPAVGGMRAPLPGPLREWVPSTSNPQLGAEGSHSFMQSVGQSVSQSMDTGWRLLCALHRALPMLGPIFLIVLRGITPLHRKAVLLPKVSQQVDGRAGVQTQVAGWLQRPAPGH